MEKCNSRSFVYIVLSLFFMLSMAPIPLLSYGFYFENSTNQPLPAPDLSPAEPNTSPSTSRESFPAQVQQEKIPRWMLQTRAAAFFPLREQLTKIYGDVLPTLEVEISCCLTSLKPKRNRWLLWENTGWTMKVGESNHSANVSRLNLIPFSLGVEYQVYVCKNLDFYFGAAPAFSLLRIKNYNGFKTTHIQRGAFGAAAKAGFRCTFHKCFFIDLYGDYYYTEFRKMRDSIQSIDNKFSGFIVGGGIGGRF